MLTQDFLDKSRRLRGESGAKKKAMKVLQEQGNVLWHANLVLDTTISFIEASRSEWPKIAGEYHKLKLLFRERGMY